jgi:hypothetical protein
MVGKHRYLKIRITPNRKINRYDLFANKSVVIHNLKANGASPLGQKESVYERKGRRMISYYVTDQEPLEIAFYVSKNSNLDLELIESSFDLLTSSTFAMIKRTPWMMPKPFVLNDAVLILQKIKTNKTIVKPKTAIETSKDTIPNTAAIKPNDTLIPKR